MRKTDFSLDIKSSKCLEYTPEQETPEVTVSMSISGDGLNNMNFKEDNPPYKENDSSGTALQHLNEALSNIIQKGGVVISVSMSNETMTMLKYDLNMGDSKETLSKLLLKDIGMVDIYLDDTLPSGFFGVDYEF